MITVDYTSNFWEVDRLENTESRSVIKKLKTHFARYGIPDQVISDNGPQYSSASFAHFSRDRDFEHLTISPGHSQSNGQVESAVKTAKRLIKKATKAKSDIYLAILDHRNTPTQGMQASPAQILMNRRTKTLLSTTASLLKPATTYNPELKHMNKKRQEFYFNKSAKDLDSLDEGQTVRMKPYQKGKTEWKKAVITKRLDERSYELETDNQTYRRNRVDLKPVKLPETPRTPEKIVIIPKQNDNASTSVSKTVSNTPILSNTPNTAATPKKSRHTTQTTKTPVKIQTPQTPQIKTIPKTPAKFNRSEQQTNETKVTTTRSGRIVKVPQRYQ